METKELRNIINSLTGLNYNYNKNTFKGGLVLEPTGRMYSDVYVIDFKRFYPHIIIQNNLFGDSLSVYLKSLLQSTINDKGETKKSSKLVLNKIYGLMKHFDFKKAELTAKIGRQYLEILINGFRNQGYQVINADTDSITIQDIFVNKCKITTTANNLLSLIKSMCVNPQDTFTLEIENHFKYIYFFPNTTGGFKKKRYIGVRDSGKIYMNTIRPNKDEELAFGLIARLLREGIHTINIDLFIKFAEVILEKNDKFINPENISIIEVTKPTLDF